MLFVLPELLLHLGGTNNSWGRGVETEERRSGGAWGQMKSCTKGSRQNVKLFLREPLVTRALLVTHPLPHPDVLPFSSNPLLPCFLGSSAPLPACPSAPFSLCRLTPFPLTPKVGGERQAKFNDFLREKVLNEGRNRRSPPGGQNHNLQSTDARKGGYLSAGSKE